MSQLATRFGRKTNVLRSEVALTEDQMRAAAPSLFATGAHQSRSNRYAYIPTSNVLRALAAEGFRPFMVAQGTCRTEGKAEYTKHMVRMRHASQVNGAGEAKEIILINSHDGSSCYQMLAGMFRFVCCNGMVCGDVFDDLRIKHTGRAVEEVVAGAHVVLDGLTRVVENTEQMKALSLDRDERLLFAQSAAALRFDNAAGHVPVTLEQIITPRRSEDAANDLWTTFNVAQENLVRGNLRGRTARNQRTTTRPVESIDNNTKLNRALWTLAEGMRRLKAGGTVEDLMTT